jgi:tetratricopeptide (TPR) repeat protein
MRSGDYPAAIDAAKAYQRRHVTDVTPYNLLGRVYQEAGDMELARETYQQALLLDNADPAANHSLAQLALAEDDIATAREHYETVLAARPDETSTLIQLAMLDARENDERAMVKRLEKASTVDPTALKPRLLLARYYLGKGRPEQVAPLFTNLSPAQQQQPDVLRLMAKAPPHLTARRYASCWRWRRMATMSAPGRNSAAHWRWTKTMYGPASHWPSWTSPVATTRRFLPTSKNCVYWTPRIQTCCYWKHRRNKHAAIRMPP